MTVKNAKPQFRDYPRWLSDKLNLTYTEWEHYEEDSDQFWVEQEELYEDYTKLLRTRFYESAFWQSLISNLRNESERYLINGAYPLLALEPENISVVRKPWDSFFHKTYRFNVLQNKSWPRPPLKFQSRWVTPNNWFAVIPDVIRTTIIVRYFDGFDIVKDIVAATAKASKLGKPSVSHEARPEGYYAIHQTVYVPLSPRVDETIVVPVEIQICTQIQDVLRALTHKLYEDRRQVEKTQRALPVSWVLEHEGFVPNHLGHMLHLADGLIMKSIEAQRKGKSNVGK